MPNYMYRARDDSGRLVKGVLRAASKDELTTKLRNLGYTPTHVSESGEDFKFITFSERFQRIDSDAMIIFNLQLANMVSSGLSLLTSMNTLVSVSENKTLKDVIRDVARSVEAGSKFSEALEKHPKIFSRLFVSMVRAGEASGNIDTLLARWAEFSERQHTIRQNVANALFYPAILFVAGILVILFIVTFVIPQFVGVFTEVQLKLPLPTVILYALGVAIKRYWYITAAGLVLIFLGVKFYIRQGEGRLRFDMLCLGLPVIGPLLRKVAVSRFSRTLGTLVRSGVPILESLEISGDVTGNEVLRRAVVHTRAAVEKGQRIGESLKMSQDFPLDAVSMISIGEETGNLDGMLNKVSDLYDTTISYTIKRLTAVIEPVFLVVMGLIVAFIMASMLLPIFDMVKMLRR